LVIVHNADGYAGGIGKLSDEAQRIAPTLRIERAVVDHLDGVGERSEGGGPGHDGIRITGFTAVSWANAALQWTMVQDGNRSTNGIAIEDRSSLLDLSKRTGSLQCRRRLPRAEPAILLSPFETAASASSRDAPQRVEDGDQYARNYASEFNLHRRRHVHS